MTTFYKLGITPTLLGKCIDDASLTRALILYGLNTDSLSGMYPVFEMAKDALGGEAVILSKEWATKRELRLFTHSANTSTERPRHGDLGFEAPSEPMTVHEAKMLIDKLLMRWIEKATGESLTVG